MLAGRQGPLQRTSESLISSTRGRVWTVETYGSKPNDDLTVVSTLHLGHAVQYRVVGEPPRHLQATETPPSLEDGYVWLMRESRVAEAF